MEEDELDGFLLPDECDEDSDEDDGLMEVNSEENVRLCQESGAIDLHQYKESVGELLNEYRALTKALKDTNHLAGQLVFGMSLQKELDKCASERTNFPIRTKLEVRMLNSGSLLLLISLESTSKFELVDWRLSLTIHVLNATESLENTDLKKSFTRTVPIKRLSKDFSFTAEVMCTEDKLIPCVVIPTLEKCIDVPEEECLFRVNLDHIYFSLWDMVSICLNEKIPMPVRRSSSRAVVYRKPEERTVWSVPSGIVFLLCDSKSGNLEKEFLGWILLENAVKGSKVDCICRNGRKMDKFTITVEKENEKYNVILDTSNYELRNELLEQLKIRILMKLRIIWKVIKGKEDCQVIVDKSSISNFFASYATYFAL